MGGLGRHKRPRAVALPQRIGDDAMASAASTGLGVRIWIAGLATFMTACAAQPPVCKIRPEAEVPIKLVNDAVSVEGSINGAQVVMQIDTGANGIASLSRAAADRLGLIRSAQKPTTVEAVGGRVDVGSIEPVPLTIGALTTPFRIGSTLDDWQPKAGTVTFDGLLGADFLSYFDVDFDFPAGRMTLYDVHGCGGDFLPWTKPYSAIHMDRAYADIATILIEIDGKKFTAIVDTGATVSGLTESGAVRLGLTPKSLASEREIQLSGFGGKQAAAHLHRFGEVKIGDRRLTDVTMPVAATTSQFADAWVGLDFLRHERMWISYSTSTLFLEN